MKTILINIKNTPDFDPERNPNDVYIGRRISNRQWDFPWSKWGNPFKPDREGVKRDGTKEEIIEKYRQRLLSKPDLMASLPELRGKRLGCWCKPDACHGDVLIELVEGRRIGGDCTVGISRIPQKSKKGRQC